MKALDLDNSGHISLDELKAYMLGKKVIK